MTIVINGATMVTADRTYEADVLVDGGVIAEIGPVGGGAVTGDQ